MLELSQLVADIEKLSAAVKSRSGTLADELSAALRAVSMEPESWPAVRARLESAKTPPWPFADAYESPAVIVPARPDGFDTANYTAIATDGSQIPLDRHAPAPYYVLNVGKVVLHYGSGERAELSSQATLHFSEEDVFDIKEGEAIPISEKTLAGRRLAAEMAVLGTTIGENSARRAIALMDGPLIVWARQDESKKDLRVIEDLVVALLALGQDRSMPVAGYISRPGHREVIGLVRRLLCPAGCAHGPADPCSGFPGLTDARLFERLLPEAGNRSVVFASRARSLESYPADQKIVFFYLNTGLEIARVEIPQWVAAEPDLLERVHLLIFDQTQKGRGYPIVLSEAHEKAVVRAADRNAFTILVESALARNAVPVLRTRKAVAKRTRIV